MKTKPKAVEKSFKATLERMQSSSLGWVIIRIPFDVSKVWSVRGRLRVKGEINGFPFRTALFPTGRGYHFLLVNKRMQAGGDVRPGGTALPKRQPPKFLRRLHRQRRGSPPPSRRIASRLPRMSSTCRTSRRRGRRLRSSPTPQTPPPPRS